LTNYGAVRLQGHGGQPTKRIREEVEKGDGITVGRASCFISSEDRKESGFWWKSPRHVPASTGRENKKRTIDKGRSAKKEQEGGSG